MSSEKREPHIRQKGIKVAFIIALLFLFLTTINTQGQIVSADTTVRETASQPMERQDAREDTVRHSPKAAVVFSAVLPGLGQVYNKKYWKVPIIYGAEGALLYAIAYNQLKYKKFRDAIFTHPTEPVVIDGREINPVVLPRGRDGYRRRRDLSVLGFVAVYFLNIVDAMVDANFFYYDVSDDLSMNVNPAIFNISDNTSAFGLTFRIGF